MGRVTLHTIAERVGVSRMTVSNAFSNPDQLSAGLRERILAVADELGYVGPDPAARALASGMAGTVGILLTDTLQEALTDEVAMTFLGAIAEELAPTGLALTLLSASPKAGIVPARDVAIDGALVYSCKVASTAVSWLMRRRLPIVFVDQAPASGIPSVNIDDRIGAEAAAKHIVDLGHRKVAIVTLRHDDEQQVADDAPAATGVYVERQRLLGWHDALHAAGIHPTIVRQPSAVSADMGYDAGNALLDRDERPTAILCFSDAIASGVVRAIHDRGLQVPEDISVVGFDDNPLAARMDPPLTTVRQDVVGKGQAAAATLTAAIERKKHGSLPAARNRHLVLPTSLIVRESTAKPRRSSGSSPRPASR